MQGEEDFEVVKPSEQQLGLRETVIGLTAEHFGVTVEDILGDRRSRELVLPRHIAMYILRTDLGVSFPEVARELGRQDHTTAMHAVRKVEAKSKEDETMQAKIDKIRAALKLTLPQAQIQNPTSKLNSRQDDYRDKPYITITFAH